MILCNTVCSASSVGAAISTNSGAPSVPLRYTPSSTRQCRWMFKLAAEPKRWISVTAPLSASPALRPACLSRWRVITLCTTCSTGVSSLGCAASSRRRGIGSDRTHWRIGTWGMTWSTRCAAVCAMRRAPHEGQKPRRLQLKATSLSWPQSPQRTLRNPWARMPHSRKASNSSLTNCGRSAPASASACAKKVAACCCTARLVPTGSTLQGRLSTGPLMSRLAGSLRALSPNPFSTT